jgi:hypothetical protein
MTDEQHQALIKELEDELKGIVPFDDLEFSEEDFQLPDFGDSFDFECPDFGDIEFSEEDFQVPDFEEFEIPEF